MVKKGFTVLKSGYWREYRGIFRVEVKATESAFDITYKKHSSRWRRMRQKKIKHCAGNHGQKHGLPAANHRASGWARRRHDVILCPHCNSFPWKTHLVGLWEKRAQQVAVRDLWIKIRFEATERAFGLTNR